MRYTSPESQPYVIALEGGPCGGKTTALNHIIEEAERADIAVTVLPEVATDFINEKQVDVPWLAQYARSEFLSLETELLGLIVGGIKSAREQLAGRGGIIVADRCDVAAYVGPHEYQQIVRQLGYAAAPHLELVDRIVYMPSLAHHDPMRYEQLVSTNSARYEDAAAARATCDANRLTLEMHPGFELIDDHDFEARLQRVAGIVLRDSVLPA